MNTQTRREIRLGLIALARWWSGCCANHPPAKLKVWQLLTNWHQTRTGRSIDHLIYERHVRTFGRYPR